MKPTHSMSASADAAAARYGDFVESLRAIFQRAIMSSKLGTPRHFAQVDGEGYEVARLFISNEEALISQEIDRLAGLATDNLYAQMGAPSPADVTDEQFTYLQDVKDGLLREIVIQVERDILFLHNSLRRAYIQASLTARGNNVPLQLAIMQAQTTNASELHFFFHDRMNRKWPSRKFVRAVWRQALLAAYNEITMMILVDHGMTTARINHIDPGASSNGVILSLVPHGELQSYVDVRDQVFHPNSDAILEGAL